MSDTAVISDRRLEREAARRRQSRRGQAIAAISTVVVLGGLTTWILAALIVWLAGALAAFLLPLVLLKKVVDNNRA